MKLTFDHDGPEGRPFTVPDERLLGPYGPSQGGFPDLDALIGEALSRPTGNDRIEQRAQNAKRVLLLIDDEPRMAPIARMLPPLLRRLDQAGITEDQITILLAIGAHRPLTHQELQERLGPGVLDHYRIVQHDNDDAQNLEYVGTTRDGMPVVVHRLLTTHDLTIGFGTVSVDPLIGYSGGSAVAMMGASGAATQGWIHWRSVTRHSTRELIGVQDNPLRRNLDEGVRLVGLDAVLDVVLDGRGQVQRIAYGDPIDVHRELVPYARIHSAVRLPQQAEVVVVEAAPADRDVCQSVRGLQVAELVAREGGTIILVARNQEGIADNHPNVATLTGLPYAEIVDQVIDGQTDDIIGAATAAYIARSRRSAHMYMVTSGVRPSMVRGLGIEPVRTVQEALDETTSGVGPHPTIAVLEKGGALLPIVPGINDAHIDTARPATHPRPIAYRS